MFGGANGYAVLNICPSTGVYEGDSILVTWPSSIYSVSAAAQVRAGTPGLYWENEGWPSIPASLDYDLQDGCLAPAKTTTALGTTVVSVSHSWGTKRASASLCLHRVLFQSSIVPYSSEDPPPPTAEEYFCTFQFKIARQAFVAPQLRYSTPSTRCTAAET
jgi:hypothetical protein